MEFVIEIAPSKRAKVEKDIFTRLDAMDYQETPDVETVVSKLNKLVNKFNREFRVSNFDNAYKVRELHSHLTGLKVVESDSGIKHLEFTDKILKYDKGIGEMLESAAIYSTLLYSVGVKYDLEIASLMFNNLRSDDLKKGDIIAHYAWSNTVINEDLERRKHTIHRLTYRIINALISSWYAACPTNANLHGIQNNKAIYSCLMHLIHFAEKPPRVDRDSVTQNWGYAFGFVKKYAWAVPVIKQIMTELEVR